MDAAAEIPELPEELTPDWLAEALGWSVRGAEQKVLGQGQGFLGDIIRLTLEHDDAAAPATVIAKLPKKANRAVGEMLGVYEREVLFFQAFGSDFPVRIPEVYFSHYDPDAGSAKQKEILTALDGLPRFLSPAIGFLGLKIAAAKKRRYLVIMEDLAQFEPGDQFEGADVEACARVLEQFAPAHRHYWGGGDLADRFWLLPWDIDARMRQYMYRRTLNQFRAEASEFLRPYVQWLGDNYALLTRKLTSEAPTTLVHNDLRLDNVCFNGTDCAYLDWQLLRSGPAAYDVAYFLGSALSEDASPGEEMAILERYHAALNRPDYDFPRFRRDYQRGLVLSLAAVVPHADIAIDAGRGQTMMARWRNRLESRLRQVDLDTLLA
ncbi:MAG TPA: phosphotransferase [Pseudomonadales bacterium]